MKATLMFDLGKSEEKLAHIRAIKSTDAYIALFSIGQEVFRGMRKNGYRSSSGGDKETDFLNKMTQNDDVVETVRILESRFYSILEEYGIDLNDLE